MQISYYFLLFRFINLLIKLTREEVCNIINGFVICFMLDCESYKNCVNRIHTSKTNF